MTFYTPREPYWAQFVRLRVAVGTAPSWVPTGTLWGEAEWGVDVWGGNFEPDWHDVTDFVEAIDTDSGRNGPLDPGDVGRATVSLYDPAGDFGLSGATLAIGALVSATATIVETGESVGLFFGSVVDADAPGDLDAATVSFRADDLLGTALADTDFAALPVSSASGRLDELLDRSLFPHERRDIQPDGTILIGVDKPGTYRIDHARAAVKSAGGTLWADGVGVIRYRDRDLVIVDDEPAVRIGTTRTDDVAPTALVLVEDRAQIVNDVFHQTVAQALSAHFVDPTSRQRYRPRPEVVTDLLNARQEDLDEVARRRLERCAWPIAHVDPCQVAVFDAGGARTVRLRIGSVVLLTYTGSDPWQRLQLVGGIGHTVTPDEWIVTIRAYDALMALDPDAPARWSLCRWGVAEWQGVPAVDLIRDFAWALLYWVDGPAARSRIGWPPPPSGTSVLSWPNELGELDSGSDSITWKPPSPFPSWSNVWPAGVDANFGQLASGPFDEPLERPYALVWCGQVVDTGDPVPFEMLFTAAPYQGLDYPGIVYAGNGTFYGRCATAFAQVTIDDPFGPVLVVADFRADVVGLTVNTLTVTSPPITDPALAPGLTLAGSPTNATTNATRARTWFAGVIDGFLAPDRLEALLTFAGRYGVPQPDEPERMN